MNKNIKTYEDLEAEKLRLRSVLKTHEENIKVDIVGVKAGLKPVGNVIKLLDKIATRDKTAAPVMKFGVEMAIDILLRRLVLARAGWLTKAVIPYLVKNYSSHLLGDEIRETIRKKLKTVFKKIRPKYHPPAEVTHTSPA